MRRVRLTAMLPPLVEFISAIGIATVFGLGCWQVVQGRLTTGWFIGYIGIVSLMFKPIKTIGLFNNVYSRVSFLLQEFSMFLTLKKRRTGAKNS